MRYCFGLLMVIAMIALNGCAKQAVATDAKADETFPVQVAEAQEIATKEPPLPVEEIREKLFIAQVNDIYVNSEEYVGKKRIRYEGVFDCYQYNEKGDMFYSVIRYGPGCCGNDGNVGFEVVSDKPYPKQNDWVRVEGMLEWYDEDGETYLRLRASALDVLPERGNDTVTQ